MSRKGIKKSASLTRFCVVNTESSSRGLHQGIVITLRRFVGMRSAVRGDISPWPQRRTIERVKAFLADLHRIDCCEIIAILKIATIFNTLNHSRREFAHFYITLIIRNFCPLRSSFPPSFCDENKPENRRSGLGRKPKGVMRPFQCGPSIPI